MTSASNGICDLAGVEDDLAEEPTGPDNVLRLAVPRVSSTL